MATREQLLNDGYCVIENILQPDMLTSVRALAARCVAAITPEHRARYRSEGSLVPEPIRARIQELYCRRGVDTDPGGEQLLYPDDWPAPDRSVIDKQRPDYRGDVAPQAWNRSPYGLA